MTTELTELVTRMRAADEWNQDDCERLCELADMSSEWANADGDNFEAVLYAAAEKLNVEII